MELSLNSQVVVAKDVVSCDLQGETAILNMKDGVYYGLDEVGTSIWKLIQEPRRVSEILRIILEEYDVERDVLMEDLMELLHQLMDNELVKIE